MKLKTLLLSLTLISAAFLTLHAQPAVQKSLYFNESDDAYITRWAFQEICTHFYDPYTEVWPTSQKPGGATVNPKDIKRGDIVFVRNIDTFMKEVHPAIEEPYLIVNHGEQYETNHDYQRAYLDDEKIVAWFSIHPLKNGHPKFHPLPLGLVPEDKTIQARKSLNEYLKALRQTTKKRSLLYVNFNTATHGARRKVKDLFAKKLYSKTSTTWLNLRAYLADMAECKFALAPRGTGPDSWRTWEALLVGTIPIVQRCVYEYADVFDKAPRCKHSTLDDLYENLPVLIINEWEEINEEFLNKKYAEITSKKYDIAPLYMRYWKEKIYAVRAQYLSNSSGII